MDEFYEKQTVQLLSQFTKARGELAESSMHPEFKTLYVNTINENIKRLQENPSGLTLTMATENMLLLEGLLKEHELSMTNAVSGLPNRLAFDRALNDVIRHIQRDPEKRIHYAILFCDGDEFSSINNTLGHNAGDRAIFEIGQKLSNTSRDEEDVYHWAGDEFAVILWDTTSHSDEEAHKGFKKALERYNKAFETNTMDYDGKTVPLSMSLGYYMIDKSDFVGIQSHEALKLKLKSLGDDALYEAKETRTERLNRIWNLINERKDSSPTLENN